MLDDEAHTRMKNIHTRHEAAAMANKITRLQIVQPLYMKIYANNSKLAANEIVQTLFSLFRVSDCQAEHVCVMDIQSSINLPEDTYKAILLAYKCQSVNISKVDCKRILTITV